MKIEINSKKYGRLSFFMRDSGGYVYLESKNKVGTLGEQICTGGKFSGNTLSATPETLATVCRKWLRQRQRKDEKGA